MKNAFLALGPESSGTRFITKLLIDAGCFGDSGHEQRLDTPDERERINENVLEVGQSPIVWRRSYPHSGTFVDISKAIAQLRKHDYFPRAVITARDWFPMLQSQIRVGYVLDQAEGQTRACAAYRTIFKYLPDDVPFVMVSYDSLTRFRYKAVHKMLQC